jgi:protein-tyrosine phosphatase
LKEIYKNLYIGNEDDVPKARERGYAIISACKDGKVSHRQLLGYTGMGAPKGDDYLVARRPGHLYLNLIDGDDPSYVPDKILDAALSFISESLDHNNPILVHCVEGKSRSASLGLLWLVKNGKLPANYNAAARQFQKLYPDYGPSDGIRLAVKKRIQALKR